MVAPRAAAWSARSSTSAAAPSPRTKPSRARSQGRDAFSGSSLRVDMARIAAKPASGRAWMTASVPPATTMSARPARMMSTPSATASAPVAQALATQCVPAFAPSSRPTQAAGPLGMSIGIVCGETRRGPLASRMSSWASRVRAPPMPEPMLTANRSGSRPESASSASRHASCAAISATASALSSRRSFTRSSTSPGSTRSWAAIRTGSCSAHGAVREVTPDRPASIASQVDATSPPSGVVAPSPVTTTSGRVITPSDSSGVLDDVADGIADLPEVLHLVVRDLDAELLFGRDDDLDHRERVDVELLGEGLLLLHVGGIDAGDLLQDLGEARGDFLTAAHIRGSLHALTVGCVGLSVALDGLLRFDRRHGAVAFREARLGTTDNLPGVGEAAAEAEEQHRRPGGHLPALHELGQSQRDTRRGRIARLDDVLGDDRVRQLEPSGDPVDDAGIRLVGHERGDLARVHASALACLQRDRGEGGGRPAEDGLALLLDV